MIVLSMSLSATPILAAAAQGQAASLSGTASSQSGQRLANSTVQVRNLATGQLAGTTTSSATGTFSFGGLQAGNYAVEVVNAAGQIVGSSASIAVAAGAAVTGVAVTSSALAVGAAAAGAAAGSGAAAGISTALIVTTVAVAAGVVGAVAVAKHNASPSR
jgi:carboxypeptidase family protein